MISLLVAGAIGLTALQAGIEIPRKNFGACLSSALDAAMAQKIAVPDYGAFVLTTCAEILARNFDSRLKSGQPDGARDQE